MKAMILKQPGLPLEYTQVPTPIPNDDQVLLKVLACGVCRTDLHIVDGELPKFKPSLILGHEIVGEVVEKGANVNTLAIGDRVGVSWLGWTCGDCYYCQTDRENLCDNARFTGYQLDGGYAEFTVANHHYCFLINDDYCDIAAAPLLCAGMIGYRALKLSEDGQKLGIYGFGAAAHIATQLAIHEGGEVYAFTKEHDVTAQDFARELGVVWAGPSTAPPPKLLDAALIFAPVGHLIPVALQSTSKAATVVCAGIHMSDIPSMPYSLLWGERVLRSVANLTRADGLTFMSLASSIRINTRSIAYPLSQANAALDDLRAGKLNGVAVLVPSMG